MLRLALCNAGDLERSLYRSRFEFGFDLVIVRLSISVQTFWHEVEVIKRVYETELNQRFHFASGRQCRSTASLNTGVSSSMA